MPSSFFLGTLKKGRRARAVPMPYQGKLATSPITHWWVHQKVLSRRPINPLKSLVNVKDWVPPSAARKLH